MKRLVIVEDQTAIREMLVEILRTDPNYQLVGESGDGQAAYTLCLEKKPDVIVLDAKLPGLNGVDLLRRLTKQLRADGLEGGGVATQMWQAERECYTHACA